MNSPKKSRRWNKMDCLELMIFGKKKGEKKI